MSQIDGSDITVMLRDDCVWIDEHTWSPNSHAKKFTLGGKMEITNKTIQKNRPITIDCGISTEGMAHPITKIEINKLKQLRDLSEPIYLTIADGRVFKVLFDQKAHIETKSMDGFAIEKDEHLFRLILHFYTV